MPPFGGDLNQVFLNLIVNAAHAIQAAAKGRGVIRVRSWVEDGHAVVAIGDTGCGIPEHVKPRIFQAFFTTKPIGKGTGQGLTLARQLVVDKHGGKISFESEAGKGTTFFVRVPLEERSSGERAA